MFRLDAEALRPAWDAYGAQPFFFPLIGTVLLGDQPGGVYTDDQSRPGQFYVEHAFGFAQVFGVSSPTFELALKRRLLTERSFASAKARIYTPLLPAFLASPECDSLRSWRQRFEWAERPAPQPEPGPLEVARPDESTAAELESHFGVVTRFWPSPADFFRHGHPVLVRDHGRPVGLCYAAAIADRRAEIDVVTLPEARRRGVGRLAVSRFVALAADLGIQPLWDCFSNNEASMNLARATGFRPVRSPYPFYTIPR